MKTKQPKTSALSRRGFLTSAAASGSGAAMLAGMNSQAAAQSSEPVVVGGPLPLTGAAAADGIEFRRGLETAADEINAMGGILGRPVQLAFADTESQGDDVISSAGGRLVDRENAAVLISGYNFGSNSALPQVAADALIPYLHADTVIAHEALVQSEPETFWGSWMYDPSEAMYGIGYLDFLRNLEESGQFTPPNRKIAIITGPIAYSINIAQAIRDRAADYGYEVSLYETVQAPISEWGPTLAKIRADEPGMIAMTHLFTQDQAQFMLQFMENPTNSLIYMQYGASLAAFREITGEASEGVLYATVIGALQDEIGTVFAEVYRERFGETASPNAGGQTYSALYAYAIAASLAGGVGEPYGEMQNRAIVDRLKDLIFRSPMGTIRFNPRTQSAYSYPSQTNDPSLGLPHIFSQIKVSTEDGVIIAPTPYDKSPFELPRWMKG